MPQKRIALVASKDSMDLETDGPLLLPELDRLGVDYEVVAWDDPSAKWKQFHAVILRGTWDYFRHVDRFREVIEHIESVSSLHNPLEAIEWNIDKRYLQELNKAGLPTVTTTCVSHLSPPTELAAALGHIGRWSAAEVVVKPTVSVGSNDTFRISASDGSAISKAVQAIVDSDRVAMIQPYLDDVDTYGERGCVFFNGRFDHAFSRAAILKPGDQQGDGLLVREDIGPAVLSDDERMIADRVDGWLIDRFGPLLFARVDLLPSTSGPQVSEVELIEPCLFLEVDPESAARFAEELANL